MPTARPAAVVTNSADLCAVSRPAAGTPASTSERREVKGLGESPPTTCAAPLLKTAHQAVRKFCPPSIKIRQSPDKKLRPPPNGTALEMVRYQDIVI